MVRYLKYHSDGSVDKVETRAKLSFPPYNPSEASRKEILDYSLGFLKRISDLEVSPFGSDFIF